MKTVRPLRAVLSSRRSRRRLSPTAISQFPFKCPQSLFVIDRLKDTHIILDHLAQLARLRRRQLTDRHRCDDCRQPAWAGHRLLEARSSGEVLEAKRLAEAALALAKITKAANETHAVRCTKETRTARPGIHRMARQQVADRHHLWLIWSVKPVASAHRLLLHQRTGDTCLLLVLSILRISKRTDDGRPR
jgi:hypothetical protein